MLHKLFFCQNIAVLREKWIHGFMNFQISTFAFIHRSQIRVGGECNLGECNFFPWGTLGTLGKFGWGSLLRGEGLLPNMEPSIFRLYLPQDMQPSPGPGKLAGCTGKLDGGVEPPLPTTHWELGIGNSRTAITW